MTSSTATPYTEQSHSDTIQMDVTDEQGFVDLLASADREIFTGWKKSKEYKFKAVNISNVFSQDVVTRDFKISELHIPPKSGCSSKKILKKIDAVSAIVSDMLKDSKNCLVVISGSGTSGRLAFFVARHFNEDLRRHAMPELYDYCISGGDGSLFFSQEAMEDNPKLGADDLQKISEGHSRVLYIGLTCGMSAPYVAGQLDYCMQHPDKFTPVLIGFNPVERARDIKIANWNDTFKSVCLRLEEVSQSSKQAFIINPTIGPEPLSGSTRMKSGTATKVILEMIFTKAHLEFIKNIHIKSVSSLLKGYQLSHETLTSNTSDLAKLVELAGRSISSNGRIYYIGEGTPGILGLIDASECVPTFGAVATDVQGFIQGGYDIYRNKEGDLSSKIKISVADFMSNCIPSLATNDLCIFLNAGAQYSNMRPLLTDIKCVLINIYQDGANLSCSSAGNTLLVSFVDQYNLVLPSTSCYECLHLPENAVQFCLPLYITMLMKLSCNAISTGAFVKSGKVYQNYMVDVKLSNIKLFHRAVGIVSTVLTGDKDEAVQLILRSIYNTDDVTSILEDDVGKHVEIATTRKKVVPTALILGLKKCSVSEAHTLLEKYPIVAEAIKMNKE